MNLIYINHYSGSFRQPREWRSYYLSKALSDEGVDVSVIGASFHHLHKEVYEQKDPVKKKSVDGLNFVWLKTPTYIGNGFRRILNMLSFGRDVFRKDPVNDLLLPRPNVIIISSAHPFHLLGGVRWAKKYNAKLIFEVRDAWPLSLNLLMGLSKFHPLSLVLYAFQFIGLRFSDKVISLPEGLKPYFEKRGMKSDKFIHVCNGIDSDFNFYNELPIRNEIELLRGQYKRIIMYTGSLGIPNALHYCIEAMNQIDNNDIAMVLIGEGSEKEKLKSMSTNKNIYFFDSVPKNSIQVLLSFADICIISWLDLPLYKYGISPNKLFDYMYASKPVINAVNSDYNITGQCDCGLTISPENVNAMRSAILELSNLSDAELKQKGKNGRQLVLENYTYKRLARKVIDEAII